MALARVASRAALRLLPARACVRFMSVQKGDASGGMSPAEITNYFFNLDSAQSASAKAAPSPLKLSGRSGEIVTALYAEQGKNFDKVARELAGLVAAVRGSGLVVDRFFSTGNYSPAECNKVWDLLSKTTEPLTTFEGIKDAEAREILVDNKDNLGAWVAARKAVTGLALSDAAKATVVLLASEGRLHLLKRVAEKAADLVAAVSRVTDIRVASAVKLSAAQQEAVRAALPAYAPKGAGGVAVTYEVDPSILGGLVITMANQTIDLSATTRLVELASKA